MADDAEERLRRMQERQDGDYQPPILVEPKGGPIPKWRPADDAEPDQPPLQDS